MEADNEVIRNTIDEYASIIATCIVLYNLCIVSNEGIEEHWIVKVDNKRAIKVLRQNYEK